MLASGLCKEYSSIVQKHVLAEKRGEGGTGKMGGVCLECEVQLATHRSTAHVSVARLYPTLNDLTLCSARMRTAT